MLARACDETTPKRFCLVNFFLVQIEPVIAAPKSFMATQYWPTTDTDDVIEHANLCLYCQECRVTRDGKDLSLAPKEYKILELLMRNPRRVWSRDQLLGEIWGIDFVGDTKTVDVHIRWLREKIETTPSSPDHIRTVRGFGYRFG